MFLLPAMVNPNLEFMERELDSFSLGQVYILLTLEVSESEEGGLCSSRPFSKLIDQVLISTHLSFKVPPE